jgi:nicotinate-nucleotide adenylyltransferase
LGFGNKKIGVFGGSFDPVHCGHLLLAQEALEGAGLDEILFMPTNIQPFKQTRRPADSIHRLAMLDLAIAENPAFSVSRSETDRSGISYTIDSLRLLRDELKADKELAFITGSDMFPNVEKWHEAEALLKEFALIVGLRPGDDAVSVCAYAAELGDRHGARISVIRNSMFQVSSSELRERVANGRSVRYRVPASVEDYMLRHGLYQMQADGRDG